MPVGVACRIGIDLCAGLHAAHTCVDESGKPLGIVHRDVSPQNVLVSVDGVAKLSDFGISKAADSIRHTMPGELKGKLAYMAPEQVDESIGTVDRRTDIFAASLTIYECLSGQALFRRGNDVETVSAVLHAAIPDVRATRPDVPARLAEALEKGLSRKPSARFDSAAELHQVLLSVAMELGAGGAGTVADWLRVLSEAAGERGLPHVGPQQPQSVHDAKTRILPDRASKKKG
jgi:serine/threonine-protein kinase